MNKTKVEPGKDYEMSNFSIGDFIVDFDDVINGIRTDNAEKAKGTYKHTPCRLDVRPCCRYGVVACRPL